MKDYVKMTGEWTNFDRYVSELSLHVIKQRRKLHAKEVHLAELREEDRCMVNKHEKISLLITP